MVVFVDLEEDDDELQDGRHPLSHQAVTSQQLQQLKVRDGPTQLRPAEDEGVDIRGDVGSSSALGRQNVNTNRFSAVLTCYPAVSSLAGHLDRNDLHSLARTCRQFHGVLVQFHHQLLSQSLRCTNDGQPLLAEILRSDDGDLVTAADEAAVLQALDFDFDAVDLTQRVLTGKIGQCARDLVAECRRCGTVVCRNCATKPPSSSLLRGRHRRLCARCKEAPSWMHTHPIAAGAVQHQVQSENGRAVSTSSSSAHSFRTSSSSNGSSLSGPAGNWRSSALNAEACSIFTAAAFAHDACTCATRGVHLCQPCGQSLRSADTTYQRVWTWRSRYSTHIGGLGTGMGEGEQGQKCGRGEQCLDAIESEVEIDCSERPAPTTASAASACSPPGQHPMDRATPSPQPASSSQGDHDLSLSAGYLRQEVEGIGGVVKKKVKKRVRVGATVCEFDDERSSGNYLGREASGRERSWCGWCDRLIVPTSGGDEGDGGDGGDGEVGRG